MNEDEINQLKIEIEQIKERNARVEKDKVWEVSLFRIVLISIITYFIAILVLFFIGIENFLSSAFIPTIGFILSTQSLPIIKKWWIKKYMEKK